MSLSRGIGRPLALAASIALIAATPGVTGLALAGENGAGYRSSAHSRIASDDDGDESCTARVALTSAQEVAVHTAQSTFDRARSAARSTLKGSLATIRAAIVADPAVVAARAAAIAAHDALLAAEDAGRDHAALELAFRKAVTAYRTALLTARTAARAQVEAAFAGYRSAVTAAISAYTTAVTAAFAPAAVPPPLLNPQGRDRHRHNECDEYHGHENDDD